MNKLQKKNMLVLGANSGQADLIRHMKTRGWRVISCAHRTGEIGETLSDEFHLIDITDTDAVAKLAHNVAADIIYSVSSDLAMTSAVSVSEMLNKPHFFDANLIDLFNKKTRMREFLNHHNLGAVPYSEVTFEGEVNDWNLFPCIVKPSDSQGQRGVQRIDKKENFNDAIQLALTLSGSQTAIVEEFLTGVEISCNVLMQNGNCLFDVPSERLVHGENMTGIPRGHLVPCINVSEEETKDALDLVHRTISALNIKNGCLYFQMKITPKGPRIIEIAPRLDGCHMWRLIKHATGQDYLASTLNTLIDRTATVTSRPAVKPGEFYELMFQQAQPQTNFKKEEHTIPQDALYHEYRYENGAEVNAINGKLENVGYYVRRIQQADIREHKTS